MPESGISLMARQLARELRRRFRRRFRGKHLIYVRDGPYPPEPPRGVKFASYRTPEAIPASIADAISERQGEESLHMDLTEIRDGSVMWVALVDDKPAGVIHSRRGCHFRQWFVPLGDNDIVIFRARTYPEFRGRGISPSMHKHVMNMELTETDHAYSDCALYNKPSRRCMQKVGYRLIATMKPITREQALHQRSE